ncbi:MAG: MurR/RpiR family transcriptional regulator [Lachnospirales bacterium]
MKEIFENQISDVELTVKQRKIASYILDNFEKIGNMSSLELAKEIGVSDASIIRFTRAIGYEGFSDLKNQIYNSLVTKSSLNNKYIIDKYEENEIYTGFTDIMMDNVKSTFEQNSKESYDRLVDKLITSKSKYIIGLRGCVGASNKFSRLLSYPLDKVVPMPNNDIDAINILQDIDEKDVLVLLSFGRYYKIDIVLLELAKSHGASICVITNNKNAPTVKYADFPLFTKSNHMSFFNSTVGASIIVEYIVTLVSLKNSEKYVKRAKERDILTKDFRI